MGRNHRAAILKLLEEQPILRPRDLTARAIPRSYLQRFVDEGILIKSGRGVYLSATVEWDEKQSMLEVARRVPHAVVCLLSALQFHELTTELPFEVWIARPAICANSQVGLSSRADISIFERSV